MIRGAFVLALCVSCSGPSKLEPDAMPADPDATPLLDAGVDAAPEPDLSGELFKPDEVLEVAIELAESDWDVLRYQTRNHYDVFAGADCQAEPFSDPYSFFPATVTVNGDRIDNVGVRKKGFFGSSNPEKPSLKLNLDYFVPGQKYSSVEDITLNNGRQPDFFGGVSHFLQVTQCLGYKLFRDMDLPAARCNFAHVTVNGRDMGLYAHVERIRAPMLSNYFADGGGLLFEGTLSDFREGWTGTFQQKSQRNTPNMAPIFATQAALELDDDDDFIAAIESAVDIDQYVRFWAMEVLTGHYDSYDANTNNFWIYQDPTTGLLNFLPWGMDWSFRGGGNLAANIPTGSALARRMYSTPAMQARYLAAMKSIIDNLWSEEDIIAEIDRMEALLDPFVIDDVATTADEVALFHAQTQQLRTFISNRRSTVEALLASPPDPVTAFFPDFCSEQNGTFAASFTATWGPYPGNPLANGSTASASGVRGGNTLAITAAGASAGASNRELFPIGLRIAVSLAGAPALSFDVYIADAAAQAGVDIPIDWISAQSTWSSFLGLADGTVHFTALEMFDGGTVKGTVTLTLYEF